MTWWAGVAAIIAPCTLVLIPFFLLFLAGAAISKRRLDRQQTSSVATSGRWFALGFVPAFVLVWSFPNAAETVIRWSRLAERAGGMVLVVYGLSLLGALAALKGVIRQRRMETTQSLALVVGATFAAGWTPCVGSTLSKVLGMTGGAQGAYASVLLGVYAFGLMTPFVLLGLVSPWAARWLQRGRPIRLAGPLVGAGLVIVGLTLLTGNLRELTAYFYSLAPGIAL